ncbi:MAG: magnesium transporter, partial [Ignavibacteriales bacterium]|nr:magnesium transporter [Ignavibacteriales bacterium]
RSIKTIEVDEELMDDIRDLVSNRASTLLLNIIADLHAADIADILDHLEGDDRIFTFDLLDEQTASAVLLELETSSRESILSVIPSDKITKYVGLIASDDAADLVAELPPSIAEKVLQTMPAEDSTDVQELMRYGTDTAGGIMGTEYIAVGIKDTVQQAMRKVRVFAKTKIPVHYVYVIDEAGLLVGVLSLEDLVFNPPSRKVYRIMNANAKSVGTDVDQEEVASTFKKYDLVALPVVDKMGNLVGRITIDDIVDVIEEEHSEDVAKMVGSDAEELERRSPAQIALLRLPWVLTTLALEFIAGVIVHLYDKTLSQVILLASFMPIISAISGNTGLQSAAIVVRAMATGHISIDRWWQPVFRQLQTTLIIGTACGCVIGFIAAIWQGKWEFGLVVGISMFFAINVSGFVGTSSPMISKRFGFDPALTAGPFETAFQDVIGITIFLSLATAMLHWII